MSAWRKNAEVPNDSDRLGVVIEKLKDARIGN